MGIAVDGSLRTVPTCVQRTPHKNNSTRLGPSITERLRPVCAERVTRLMITGVENNNEPMYAIGQLARGPGLLLVQSISCGRSDFSGDEIIT